MREVQTGCHEAAVTRGTWPRAGRTRHTPRTEVISTIIATTISTTMTTTTTITAAMATTTTATYPLLLLPGRPSLLDLPRLRDHDKEPAAAIHLVHSSLRPLAKLSLWVISHRPVRHEGFRDRINNRPFHLGSRFTASGSVVIATKPRGSRVVSEE